MPKFAIILPAAGKSTRFGTALGKKVFANLAGKPVWLHSVERFAKRSDVSQILVVISAEDRDFFETEFAKQIADFSIQLVDGGVERCDSINNALSLVEPDIDYVAVHDAARPCVADESIDQVFQAAQQYNAAMLAFPVSGTLKRVNEDLLIEETVDRQNIWEAQTPQVFEKALLQKAYAQKLDSTATDDAQLVEHLGHAVKIVRGSSQNIKITNPSDFAIAETAISDLNQN